jgi:chromosome segregation ATPase
MTKWNDPEATVDQKLEFLRLEIISLSRAIPSPMQFEESSADKQANEKQVKSIELQLSDAFQRIRELQEWKEETDKRIQRLTDRINQISMNNANQPQVAAAD